MAARWRSILRRPNAPSIEAVAAPLGLSVPEAAARIVEVVNANMAQALRIVSVERGHDPQEFSLIAFGGAGPVHAAALAEELQIPEVIIPPVARRVFRARAGGERSEARLLAHAVCRSRIGRSGPRRRGVRGDGGVRRSDAGCRARAAGTPGVIRGRPMCAIAARLMN